MSRPRLRIRHRALAGLCLVALAGTGVATETLPAKPLPLTGAPVVREAGGGEAHRYTLDRLPGDELWLSVEQEGIDVSVAVLTTRADGETATRLAVDSPSGRWGTEWLRLAVQPGDTAVEIRALSADAPRGRYRLTVDERRSPGPETRRRDSTERAMTAAGRLYLAGGRDVERRALTTFRTALEGWTDLHRHEEAAATLFHVAILERKLESPSTALGTLRRALASFESLDDRQGQARAWMEIGRTLHHLGPADEADAAFERSLELWRGLDDRHGQARVLGFRGLVHMRDAPQRARALHEEALALARELGDRRQEGASLNALGGVDDLVGEPELALDRYRQALLIHQELGDRRQEAALWNNIASIHQRTGRLSQALEGFEESLEVLRALDDRRGQAPILNNLGLTWLSLGDGIQARDALTRALEIRREAEDAAGVATTLHNLGLVDAEEDAWDAAIATWTEALSIRRNLGARREEAASLVALGHAAYELERLDQAQRLLRDALGVLESIDDRWRRALAQRTLGQVLTAAGRPDEAVPRLEQAVDTFRALDDPVATGSALLALAEAVRAASSAETTRDDLSTAYEHATRAVDLLADVRSDVDGSILRATFFARHAEAFETAVDLAMDLARHEPSGGWAARALEISERARARSLLDSMRDAGVAPSPADPELVERQRSLLAQLQLRVGDRRRALVTRGSAANDLALASEIESLRHRLAAVDEEIRRADPATERVHPTPLTASEIRALLDPDTLLLEVALGEARSFLWLVSSRGVDGFELPGRAVVEAMARDVYERFRVQNPRSRDEDAQAARRLSEVLLGPIADRLGGRLGGRLGDRFGERVDERGHPRRLAIVADGALHYLPFAALPHPAEPSEPLLARHEIVRLSSASALGARRRALDARPPAPGSLAVLADPVFDLDDARLAAVARTVPIETTKATRTMLAAVDPTFVGTRSGELVLGRLPWSRWEAQRISEHVGDDSLVALDFEADLETVRGGRLRGRRWIHFATHGVVESDHPELSALVFSLYDADGRRRDGFLRLPEIYHLELDADLVVLSGCRTALGPEVRGEGLVGLTRGFFAAGAHRLVASLWGVQDRASAELMARFYERLTTRTDDSSPAALLREAQLELRAQPGFDDPYFWAAFAVYGDW